MTSNNAENKSKSFSEKFKQDENFQTFLEAKAAWRISTSYFNSTSQRLRNKWIDYYKTIEIAYYRHVPLKEKLSAESRAKLLVAEIQVLEAEKVSFGRQVKISKEKIEQAKKAYRENRENRKH